MSDVMCHRKSIEVVAAIIRDDEGRIFATQRGYGEWKDWLSSTEEQLRQRDDSIRSLNAQLDAYEALVLPSEQIAAELRSQWPEITDVTLARADSSIILLLSTPSVELPAEDTQRIQNWLSVRLQTPKVEVIVR